MNYAFEMDFLPVGDGTRSGDAIAMRWRQPDGLWWVAVVDGGTMDSGQQLVDHVRQVYGTGRVNLVINTHPDADHASGLSVVLEQMRVDELWMHRPWQYSTAIANLFQNRSLSANGLSGRIREALDAACELERIAIRKGIHITEPFQGLRSGPLLVLSPNRRTYLSLIPHFENTPTPAFPSPLGLGSLFPPSGGRERLGLRSSGLMGLQHTGLIQSGHSGVEHLGLRSGGLIQSASVRGPQLGLRSPLGLTGLRSTALQSSTNRESWTRETLGSDGRTSEQNESSVVLFCDFGGQRVLLTADAGLLGLQMASCFALNQGIDLRACSYYQVPHHGSRRNVSPEVLNLIVGSPWATPTRYAIASVASESTTHPRKAVVNAFLRRGVSVCATKGRTITIGNGYPRRQGYTAVELLPFFGVVDAP